MEFAAMLLMCAGNFILIPVMCLVSGWVLDWLYYDFLDGD